VWHLRSTTTVVGSGGLLCPDYVSIKGEIVSESSTALVQDLIDAGVHFGHRASRWNPKMRPYIYGRKKLIHILDVRETVRGLLRARKFIREVASKGGIILFVGTKRQASETIEREALRCKMPFVAERWLGGTLTNFRTIRSRLGRLEELETIRAGEQLATYSKKMQSALSREYRKMYRNLNGMRTMTRIPDCMVIVDSRKEKNAVREASRLGVPTLALIDTDCDPDLVDLPIPGNDDGIRSIEVVISYLANAVIEGAAMAGPEKDSDVPGSRASRREVVEEPAVAATEG
jgi:small subunit ribosomal protein S2